MGFNDILLERPSQPLNFIVIYENTTSLILNWREPANIDGEIDHYIVCVFHNIDHIRSIKCRREKLLVKNEIIHQLAKV